MIILISHQKQLLGKIQLSRVLNSIHIILVDEAVEKGLTIPKLLIQCGTEDFLYEDNQQFMTYLDDKGIDYQYEEGPGQHDYAFWDKAIKRTIEWLVEE